MKATYYISVQNFFLLIGKVSACPCGNIFVHTPTIEGLRRIQEIVSF